MAQFVEHQTRALECTGSSKVTQCSIQTKKKKSLLTHIESDLDNLHGSVGHTCSRDSTHGHTLWLISSTQTITSYYIILHHITSYYIILHHTAAYLIVLQHTKLTRENFGLCFVRIFFLGRREVIVLALMRLKREGREGGRKEGGRDRHEDTARRCSPHRELLLT